MKNFKLLSIAVATSLSTASLNSQALGLGSGATEGVLNRPLQIELPLIAESYDLHDIKASLADQQQHQRFGLLFPQWMPKLKFNVVETNQGPVLQVTSRQPIKEPIVNFVIQVNYKEMLLFKEVTLFLNPAALAADNGSSSNIGTTDTTPSSVIPVANVTSSNEIIPATPVTATIRTTELSQSFRVQRGQSLWRIARAWKVEGVSINQKMQAIYQTNKHAFVNGDKNKLKQGSMLNFSPESLNVQPEISAEPALASNSQSQNSQPILNSQTVSEPPVSSAQPINNTINQPIVEPVSQSSALSSVGSSVNQRLQVEQEIIELNATIERQQALNESLKLALVRMQQQLELQQQINTAQTAINQAPAQAAAQVPVNITPTQAENQTLNQAAAPIAKNPPIQSQQAAETTTESVINSSGSSWLTAIWFTLALVLAYLGSILSSKRKARVFAKNLDHKLQDIAYNDQREKQQTPTVKELSIPKNLSTSVQIKYLNSAADFYIRCHRHDLAKELVNEGLIEFSGNPQIIRTLNEIRRKIFTHLDSDLHEHIVEKLDARSHEEQPDKKPDSELGFDVDDNSINIEDFNEHWLKQWGKKVS